MSGLGTAGVGLWRRKWAEGIPRVPWQRRPPWGSSMPRHLWLLPLFNFLRAKAQIRQALYVEPGRQAAREVYRFFSVLK